MSNSIYASLTRQSGLMSELRVVANNIANSATTGFKAEGVIFSEYVSDLGPEFGGLSMGRIHAKSSNFEQGAHTQTGGRFDFAISGDGYFAIETQGGNQLTRAGVFLPNDANELVTPDGLRVLDAGLAPIFIPPDANDISLAPDGTLSADGRPIAQLGIFALEEGANLKREGSARFSTENEFLPADETKVSQGFLESSNVDPVLQISRLIEVQRSYEAGQSFLENEDERIRSILNLIQR